MNENVNTIDLFKYIKKEHLCPRNLIQEDKEVFLNKIGFSKKDNDKFDFDHNMFAIYLKSCIHVVLLQNGEFALYNSDGYYELNCRLLLAQIIKLLLNQVYSFWNVGYENSVLEALKRDIRTQVLRFDTGDYINLKNGMLNVNTMKLMPHFHTFHSSVQVPINFDIKAKCPLFLKFIKEITYNDVELETLIQEMLGYVLQSSNKAHKAFLLVGNGSNGKSVLADIIQHLVGLENTSNVPLGGLCSSFGLASLVSKLLNVASENDCGTVNSEIFKALTSGDRVDVNIKYQPSISCYLQAKLVFLFNALPSSADYSNGFYRRIIIIPFNRTFNGSEVDVDLTEKLLLELDGILIWALDGLKRLLTNNFRFSNCKASNKCLKQYKSEQNPTGLFLEDCLQPNEKSKIKKSLIFNYYENWCSHNGINSVTNKQMFWVMLKATLAEQKMQVTIKKIKGIDYFCGYEYIFQTDELQATGLNFQLE